MLVSTSHESPGNTAQAQTVIQQFWGEAFLTSFTVMLTGLVLWSDRVTQGPRLNTHSTHDLVLNTARGELKGEHF